jgi:DNA-binding HxlR family transcriptional regulator
MNTLCDKCNGSGFVKLPEHLDMILKELLHAESATAGELREILWLKHDEVVLGTAMSMRLKELQNLKLITRSKNGRWEYKLTQKAKEQLCQPKPKQQ